MLGESFVLVLFPVLVMCSSWRFNDWLQSDSFATLSTSTSNTNWVLKVTQFSCDLELFTLCLELDQGASHQAVKLGSCSATWNQTHYVLKTGITECGTVLNEIPQAWLLTNTLSWGVTTIKVECAISRPSITLYSSSAYTHAITSPIMTPGTPLYVALDLGDMTLRACYVLGAWEGSLVRKDQTGEGVAWVGEPTQGRFSVLWKGVGVSHVVCELGGRGLGAVNIIAGPITGVRASFEEEEEEDVCVGVPVAAFISLVFAAFVMGCMVSLVLWCIPRYMRRRLRNQQHSDKKNVNVL